MVVKPPNQLLHIGEVFDGIFRNYCTGNFTPTRDCSYSFVFYESSKEGVRKTAAKSNRFLEIEKLEHLAVLVGECSHEMSIHSTKLADIKMRQPSDKTQEIEETLKVHYTYQRKLALVRPLMIIYAPTLLQSFSTFLAVGNKLDESVRDSLEDFNVIHEDFKLSEQNILSQISTLINEKMNKKIA